MKKDLKVSLSLLLKLVIAAIICFFLMLSINVVCNALGEKIETGYVAYGQKGEGDAERLYTYHYSEGDDLKYSAYESQGYKIEKSMLYEMSKGTKITYNIITLTMTLLVLVIIIYDMLWDCGFKDSNLVRFGHIKKDLLRGFKIGIIANVPYTVFYLAILVLSGGALKNFNMTFYKLPSCYLYTVFGFIFDNPAITAVEVTTSQWILTALLLLVVPIISGISYYLGFKEISIGERLVYKNKGKR